HGGRYYGWELKEGRFGFFEHPVNLQQEQALEGKYLIQTEEPNLSAIEAVAVYKEISEGKRALFELKDVIQMRPIYHKKARRVEAHVFVASLAFLPTEPWRRNSRLPESISLPKKHGRF